MTASERRPSESGPSLRGKLRILGCTTAICTAVLIGSANFYWLRHLAVAQSAQTFAHAAIVAAAQIDDAVAQLAADAKWLASQAAAIELVREATRLDPPDVEANSTARPTMAARISSLMDRRPLYRSVQLFDLDGRHIRLQQARDKTVSSPNGVDPAAVSNRAAETRLMRGPACRTRDDIEAICVATPIRNNELAATAQLILTADLPALVEQATSNLRHDARALLTFDARRQRTPLGDLSGRGVQGVSEAPFAGAASDLFRAVPDGRGNVVVTVPLARAAGDGIESHGRLVVTAPEAAVFADAISTQRQAIGISLVILASALVAVLTASNLLIAPLRHAVTALRGYVPGTRPALQLQRSDEVGEIARAVYDLVGRIERSRALEETTHARLRAIVDNTLDGLVSFDRDGVILRANKGAAALFGRPQADLPGMSIRDIIVLDVDTGPGGDGREAARLVAGTLQESVGRRADGTAFPIELTIAEVKTADGTFYTAIARDISDRRRLETSLREQSEALRKSNEHLEEFAYIASHDLKEPLRAIRNHARFLREDHGAAIGETGAKRVERIQSLCGHAERVILDLLEYSRLGHVDLTWEEVDMRNVVEDVRTSLADTLRERNASIVVRGDLPPLRGDRTRLTSLLHNLALNAIKYNDSEERLVEIGFEPAPDPAIRRYVVRDNGIGIPEKYSETVFKMFKRLHGEESYGSGTGAGLSFCRKIVDRHGGTIRFESQAGGGTTFYLDFASETGA